MIRINKALAERGGYSRREADRIIAAGRVSIARRIVTDLATRVSEDEEIYIDGKKLPLKSANYTAIVYHKPRGEIVTRSDPEGRRTIYESLPEHFSRFLTVGRLDYSSEGLLILTDSAEVATKLMTGKLERLYNVKIDGWISEAIQKAMSEGIELDSSAGAHPQSRFEKMRIAPFLKWRIEKNHPHYSRLKIVLDEGKNREIRRFFAHFERQVLDLRRVEFGFTSLNALSVGKWRFFTKKEYRDLHEYMRTGDAKPDERSDAK